MLKTNIIISLQYAATHFWSGCNIQEVIYLKDEHRHVFHITCKKEVSHDDRDVEIISFKNEVLGWLDFHYKGKFGGKSCEMIARELLNDFELNYCKVLEDNENGAEIFKTDN